MQSHSTFLGTGKEIPSGSYSAAEGAIVFPIVRCSRCELFTVFVCSVISIDVVVYCRISLLFPVNITYLSP